MLLGLVSRGPGTHTCLDVPSHYAHHSSEDTVSFRPLWEAPGPPTLKASIAFNISACDEHVPMEFMGVSGGFFGLGVRIPQCASVPYGNEPKWGWCLSNSGCHSHLESLVPDGVAQCATWVALGGGPIAEVIRRPLQSLGVC
ncbi:hypothetical protein MDA_GLEAN10021409 [Myotis davidii]|uniref:Uncharacterized protein n=1 Tax=Myotis davidii TaxID=225400 RepID=L5LS93_MYODS|nr:hypothetical protein MDA_GLEAN10021409 [Myotis davidii]